MMIRHNHVHDGLVRRDCPGCNNGVTPADSTERSGTDSTATADDLRAAAARARDIIGWWSQATIDRANARANRLEASARLEPATTALIEAALAKLDNATDIDVHLAFINAGTAYRAALASVKETGPMVDDDGRRMTPWPEHLPRGWT